MYVRIPAHNETIENAFKYYDVTLDRILLIYIIECRTSVGSIYSEIVKIGVEMGFIMGYA